MYTPTAERHPSPAPQRIQSYSDDIGTLAYTLHRSPVLRDRPPLFLMLHGGGQSAADFAEITQMHEFVKRCGGLALFPTQSRDAHPLGCWNWYSSQHQVADRGEPAMLAGLTRSIVERYGVDRRRVYVAGMSAGGAMAAILGQTYPDLYAAVGVHSGLPTGIAHDVLSAMRAMTGGPPVRGRVDANAQARPARAVPIIVFYGDRDQTVHPSNATAVIEEALGLQPGGHLPPRRTASTKANEGNEVTLTRHRRRPGRPDAEMWMVHGAGHTWTGGAERGRNADTARPNASREMLRFFLSQALGSPARRAVA